MASHRAITAVSGALCRLLEVRYDPAAFDGQQLLFRVYAAKDFAQPMDAGVSVFLYRAYVNRVRRSVPGRPDAAGRRTRPQLPVDLHYLVTAWAKEASLQHAVAGWMMRVLEDTPVLPAGLLNHTAAGVFRPDETAEVGVTDLTTEELFRIWEVIVDNAYQLSVPYLVRGVTIESELTTEQYDPVQERAFDWGERAGP